MLKASNALLKAAMIVGTIVGAIVLATVPFFFVIGFSPVIRDMLIEAMKQGEINVQGDATPYELGALIIQVSFVVLAFSMLIVGGMCVANAIIASRTRREPTRGLYIACIVTGAMSTDFSLVAGILGLINLNRELTRKRFEE